MQAGPHVPLTQLSLSLLLYSFSTFSVAVAQNSKRKFIYNIRWATCLNGLHFIGKRQWNRKRWRELHPVGTLEGNFLGRPSSIWGLFQHCSFLFLVSAVKQGRCLMQIPLFPASYWLTGKSVLSCPPTVYSVLQNWEWMRMEEDHSKDTGVHDCTHVTEAEHSTQLERKTKENKQTNETKEKTPE